MDPDLITDFIQFAKSASPCGAVAVVALGIIRLICELRQPRALAAAVKTMDSQEDKEALIEMYRINKMSKSAKPPSRRKPRP